MTGNQLDVTNGINHVNLLIVYKLMFGVNLRKVYKDTVTTFLSDKKKY